MIGLLFILILSLVYWLQVGEISAAIFLGIGGFVGLFWLIFDQLLYPLYASATDEQLLSVRELAHQQRWRQYFSSAWALRSPQAVLITRSLWFLIVFTLLAIFAITSGSSAFGFGFILGTGWWYLWEITKLTFPASFRSPTLLWQVGQAVPAKYLPHLWLGSWILFGGLTLMVLL